MGKLSIIAAVAGNGALGKDNDLLWHLPDDLRRFKKITSGHYVIMGKKTYYSMPVRPLPNRVNVVLSRDPDLKLKGAVMARSVDEAVTISSSDPEAFVLGGGKVYHQFIGLVDKLYITKVHAIFRDADTFFPAIDEAEWELIEERFPPEDEQAELEYSYLTYRRRP